MNKPGLKIARHEVVVCFADMDSNQVIDVNALRDPNVFSVSGFAHFQARIVEARF